MRYIKTNNRHVELVEADSNGKILSSKGFQFGQLYYQIKNNKVTFYMIDNENPWRNDVWTSDIPLQVNDEVYSTPEEVGGILYEIMNDSLQEQIDDLKVEDGKLHQEIDDESERAKEVESNLQEQIDAIEDIEMKLDQEIARSTSKDTEHDNLISGLTNVVNNEITRSTAKDAEHDGLISGLTTSLNNEIQRAINAENNLLSGLTSEISRATNAENELDIKIDNEITRSTAKDTQHDEKILALENANSTLTQALNSEISRAMSAETEIANDLDAEVTRATNRENNINSNLNSEITRSTNKDTEHDEKLANLRTDLTKEIEDRISGDTSLQNQLNSEISRATNAENALDVKIDQEISDRIADVNTEETRAIAEEQRIEDKLDSEITRSTAKDASHDVLISGLTDSLNTEIQRATTAENALKSDLNAETQNRISGDTSLQNQINAEVTRSTTEDSRLNQAIGDEATRATAAEANISNALNNEIQRAMSAETELHNEILSERTRALDAESGITLNLTNEIARATAAESALTADIATINTILPTKADKVDAVASAEYISQSHIINFKNINGDVISSVDANDFIKDGMVSDAYVRGENLVITFNTDSGKENIEIPISDIFNANNYYTKAEVDASQAVQDTKIGVISGRVETLDVKVSNLSANTYTKAEVDASQSAQDAKINSLSGDISSIVDSLDDYATEQWVLDKHYISGVDLSDYASKEYVSGFTYDKATIDEKIEEGGTFDPTQYYTKTQSDAKYLTEHQPLKTINGNVISGSGNIEIASNNVIELTQAEYDAIPDADKDPDAFYILTDAEDIDLSNYYTKVESDGRYMPISTVVPTKVSQLQNDVPYLTSASLDNYVTDAELASKGYLTEHQPLKTINGNVISGSGNIEIASNNVIELTQAEYDALTEKDLDAFYIITDAEGINLSNYYTKAETSGATEISTALASKLDVSAFNTYSGAVNTQLNSKASESDLNALNDTVTAHTTNTSVHTTDAEKTSWNGAVTKSNANETALGGLKLVSLTQSQYDALATKDSSTIYFIKE